MPIQPAMRPCALVAALLGTTVMSAGAASPAGALPSLPIGPKAVRAPSKRPGGGRAQAARPVSTDPLQVVGELSDAQADGLVQGGVVPDRRSDNWSVDHRMPTAAELAYFRTHDNSMPSWYLARITGAHTGTTDEIIQWAAYKWGLDPNLLRAVAAVETWWHQSFVGNDGSAFGLFQLRIPYHCCRPLAQASAAFDADYYGAILRSYYDGAQTWLNTVSGNGARYTAHDLFGSVGYWASGRWRDGAAYVYIAKVKHDLATRPWFGQWF